MFLFLSPFDGRSFSGVCSFTRVSSLFPQPGRVLVSASGAWVRTVVDFHAWHAVFSSPLLVAGGFPQRGNSMTVISPPHSRVSSICWSPWVEGTFSTAGDQLRVAGRAFLFFSPSPFSKSGIFSFTAFSLFFFHYAFAPLSFASTAA